MSEITVFLSKSFQNSRASLVYLFSYFSLRIPTKLASLHLLYIDFLIKKRYDLLFYFNRELRRKTANKILVNLSFSILGLLVCFLLGVEFVETNGICTTIGVFLHVFVLSTFMWMTVEAIGLYRKAVRTFKNRGEGTIFFRTCFCLAWGTYAFFSQKCFCPKLSVLIILTITQSLDT